MKYNLKIERMSRTLTGDLEITFVCKNFHQQESLMTLNKEAWYLADLNEVKSKRSLEQNRLLWALIKDIVVAESGRTTEELELEIYCKALEQVGAKVDYILALPETINEIKEIKGVRVVLDMKQTRKVGNKELHIYKLVYGSSRFNIKEMTELLEWLIDYATQLGVDVDAYKV